MAEISLLSGLRALCVASAGLADVDGASVSLFTRGGARARITASGLWAAHLDELQFDTGEGPCFEAFAADRAVRVDDLADLDGAAARFPAFAARAVQAGVRWMLAVPLRHGTTAIGVLDLMRREPHPAPENAERVARLAMPLAAEALHGLWLVDPDAGVPDIDGPVVAVDGFAEELSSYRWEVHQAVGSLRARHGVDTGAALAQLRAAAFAEGRSLLDVAVDVLEPAHRRQQGGGA